MSGFYPASRAKRFGLVTGTIATTLMVLATFAITLASAQTATCSNLATLGASPNGSAFEIDTAANLLVNTAGCIDWLAGGSRSGKRSGVITKGDKPSGASDDSFGQGTSVYVAIPTIVSGSIPPNKRDL